MVNDAVAMLFIVVLYIVGIASAVLYALFCLAVMIVSNNYVLTIALLIGLLLWLK